jgi:hypothetical protein
MPLLVGGTMLYFNEKAGASRRGDRNCALQSTTASSSGSRRCTPSSRAFDSTGERLIRPMRSAFSALEVFGDGQPLSSLQGRRDGSAAR